MFDAPARRQQHGCAEALANAAASDIELLALPDDVIAEVDLYRSLAAWSQDLVSELGLPTAYLALPASTYHVTVCDGLSVAQIEGVDGSTREWIAQMLGSLPGSIVDSAALLPSGVPSVAHEQLTDLLECAASPIDFTLARIETRRHAVVAALEPVDACLPSYSQIVEARDAFLSRLSDELGVNLITPWRPHVSLGYWVNTDAADEHEPDVAAGGEALMNAGSCELRVLGSSVHAFDDMATYWRPSTASAVTTPT